MVGGGEWRVKGEELEVDIEHNQDFTMKQMNLMNTYELAGYFQFVPIFTSSEVYIWYKYKIFNQKLAWK